MQLRSATGLESTLTGFAGSLFIFPGIGTLARL